MNHLRRPGLSRAERHGKAATVSRSGGVHEAHDLPDRFGYTWLAAWSRVQLGTLDVAGGQLAEARALLDEALDLSLAIHINRNMALCLVAFAPAGVRGGPPGGCGAAGRGGRRPPAAGSAADLVAQARQAQGAVRFDEAFAAGPPAQPAGGCGRHPGPAPHRHPGALTHGLACLARHRHGHPDLLLPGSPGHLWPTLPMHAPGRHQSAPDSRRRSWAAQPSP